jgi:hypothetical protein
VLSYDHRPKPKVIVITSGKQRIVTFSLDSGLISTDRGTKTTLMRTIPRSILSRIQRICLSKYLLELLSPTAPALSGGGRTVLSYDHRPKPKVIASMSDQE